MLLSLSFLLSLIATSKIHLAIASCTVDEIDRAADDLFRDYWEFIVSSEPEFATQVGDFRFNNKLNSYALSHYENEKWYLTRLRVRANHLLHLTKSGSDTYTNLELLSSEIRWRLSLLNIKRYLFPVSYLEGPPGTLVNLLDYVPMSSMKDFNNLVSRYRAFPRQVHQIIELLKEGIRNDTVLNKRSLRDYENQTLSYVAEPKDSIFYKPFEKASQFIPPEYLDYNLQRAADSIRQSLNPGLKKLANFIKNTYRKHLRKDIAVSSLPNGKEYYQQVLSFFLTDEVTPQEIHNLGLEEVARISKEIDKVFHSFGENVSKQEFNEGLRKNESNYFQTKEEALNAYNDILRNKIEPILPRFFKESNLPRSKLKIKQIDAGGTGAYYLPTYPNGHIKGTFYLDTSDLKILPKYRYQPVGLHESVPGHHLQISFISEKTDAPMFRKRDLDPLNTAYVEGWATYSEFLGKEMGLYHDKYMLYGYLYQEMSNACVLVAETGIHAMNWSSQRAIDYLSNNTILSEESIEQLVDRVITLPGQGCSYTYGALKIRECRSKAEKTLGPKFSLKDFHDVVLRSCGPVPFLEKQVKRYIENFHRH